MKPSLILAVAILAFLGMWLVLQPTLEREAYDYAIRIGGMELLVTELTDSSREGAPVRRFVAPPDLASLGELDAAAFDHAVEEKLSWWNAKPSWERVLLGFLNISNWENALWVFLGLAGQAAFFGRMLVQWVVSERAKRSEVPVAFWWLSLIGGLLLFAYFVWRRDPVGVLGQSTGVVIYERNLRLIAKERIHS
jgi:lipid-A-disaccharide synthase-like uncharacterized protein